MRVVVSRYWVGDIGSEVLGMGSKLLGMRY